MDIAILLWFQKLRIFLGPAVEIAVSCLSDFFGAAGIPLILYLFWFHDRKKGRYLLLVLAVSFFLNQFLKVTFAVYRPWIRSPLIEPASAALRRATGYSFPSGHTQCACASCFGICSVTDKQFRKQRMFLIFGAVFAAFSRMYLGVHTPQDVLVGVLAAGFSAWISGILIRQLENEEKRKAYIAGAVLLSVLSAVYTITKSYPVHYIDGIIVVSPLGMKIDSLQNIGMFAGTFCFLFLNPDRVTPVPDYRVRLIKAAAGFALTAAVYFLVITVSGLIIDPEYTEMLAALITSAAAVSALPSLPLSDRRS